MYTEDRIRDIKEAESLLNECGLTIPQGVEYTVGIYDNNEIVATGSIKGDMIQGMAVSPNHQGEDLSARVITHLINKSFEDGKTSLNLFTKPSKASTFASLGFKTVAVAKPYAALLEWGSPNISNYTNMLKTLSNGNNKGVIGGMVMNCNPITKGHLYLIEKAASMCDHIYILVVEEDISLFPFKARIELVKKATAHIKNVTVVGGGRYCVSSMTFPSYFTKDESVAKAHCSIDLEIFKKHIAPALGIKKRFVGTEPLSPVTNVYNETMKELLPQAGIEVIEVARKEEQGEPISASRVRKLLEEKDFEQIKLIVPTCTYEYIIEHF